MKHGRVLVVFAGFGLLGMPAFSADYSGNLSNPAEPPRPGTVNYIEGAAYSDGKILNNQSVGNTALNAGDVLTTDKGKAEILLTPGIFLRVGDHSTVKMVSPALEQTNVDVERGRAAVEVDQIFPQNMVQITDGGVTTQLMKTGYYEFDANQPEVMVFKGQAEVELGDGKWEKVKNHHELALLEDAQEKTANFDAKPTNDDLYNWSSLRSRYLAEANNQIAGEYEYGLGFNPGWYWDPWMWDYTFLGPGPFFSPFGWGFYPWGGLYGGWNYYGHPIYRGGGYYHGGFHAAPAGGFHGGGFHAGGGFHGGGGFAGGGRR